MITHQQTTLDQMSSAVPFLPRENCDRLDAVVVELISSSAAEGLLVRARKVQVPPLRNSPCTIHVLSEVFIATGLGLGLESNAAFLEMSRNI